MAVFDPTITSRADANKLLNVDIAPTVLKLAGIPVPAAIQGRSLVPLFKGEEVENWRKDWLYENYEYPQWEHVRPILVSAPSATN